MSALHKPGFTEPGVSQCASFQIPSEARTLVTFLFWLMSKLVCIHLHAKPLVHSSPGSAMANKSVADRLSAVEAALRNVQQLANATAKGVGKDRAQRQQVCFC